MIVKKYRFKPLYKKFIKLRENVQNRKKLLNFKKKKWKRLIKHYKNKLKRYRKFKPQDQNKYFITKYPNKGTAYNKLYRDTSNENKKFSLFYGGFHKKILKKITKTILTKTKKHNNLNILLIKKFENRLDVILYQSKFSPSVRNARQLIVHGKVLVNNKIIKNKSYILNTGDIIKINLKHYQIIERNIQKMNIWWPKPGVWPIPPKHLLINYKIMQIIVGTIKHTNISVNFPFYINLERILKNRYKY